jgi:hypothetical protein
MIRHRQTIAQRNIYGAGSDSADFAATPLSTSIVLVDITFWPSTAAPTVTVGGVSGTAHTLSPQTGSERTRSFYAYGSFASATVAIGNMTGAYYWWAAREWRGLVRQAPTQEAFGSETSSPTPCGVTTTTLAQANSLVLGVTSNNRHVSPSEWAAPTDYTMGPLNIQDWNNAASGCSVYRIVNATTAQSPTMGSPGSSNYGRMVAAVYAGTTDVIPTLVSLTPVDDATDVDVGIALELEFDVDVEADSGNISIYETDGDVLVEAIDVTDTGLVTVSGDTVTVTPTAPLDAGTEYYVLVDATAIVALEL